MTIPNDLRAPFMYVEFDASRANQGPSILRYQALLIGQRLSSGDRAELIIDRITSYDQARALYGEGSQLARMFKAWFKNNKTTDVFGVSQDDGGGSVAATGTITITGPATAAGNLVFYIGGDRVSVAIASADTATEIGDAIVAALLAESPVTAVNVTGVVTFTSRNKGEAANDIPLAVNFLEGEELPAGVTAAVVQMTSGVTNPDVQEVIDILGDEWYQIISAPYVDATNLTAIEAELDDRFGPTRMIDGQYVCSKRAALGALATFGNGRNSKYVTCMHSNQIQSISYEHAVSYAGQLAAEGQADPARPFQTLELVGIIPPPVVDRFTSVENNSLLFDGISTFYVDNGGKVRIQRAITMYQTNAQSSPDTAYLDVNTLLNLLFLRFDFRTQFSNRYPRAKLADDGVQAGPGQVIMTPSLGKSEAINIFRGWLLLGLVENVDQFKNEVICQRSITDQNRLEFILPPDLMNQFRVGAATMQFL